MDCLPSLDIQDDLDNLNDDHEPAAIEVVEDLSVPQEETFVKQPEDIFVGKPTNGTIKPPVKASISVPLSPVGEVEAEEEEEIKPVTKRKKVISEKQKAHLERIRSKAAEKKRIQRLEKQAITDRVTAEMEAKKSKKKIKVVMEDKPLTDDFKERMKIPSAEEEKQKKIKSDENQFMDFMMNMEKFEKMRHEHQQKINAKRQKTIDAENKKKAVIRPKPRTVPHPQSSILKPPSNPYHSAFDW